MPPSGYAKLSYEYSIWVRSTSGARLGPMFTVFVEQLEFYAYHGVPDEEQKIGHRYAVSVALEVEGDADETDAVSDTVDYGEVCRVIVDTATSRQTRTLEKLGGDVCDALFAKFDKATDINLRLWKPNPPAPFVVAKAGIEIYRARN